MNMKKEEFIKRYGEDAYNKMKESSKLWHNERKKDPEYLKERRAKILETTNKWRIKNKEKSKEQSKLSVRKHYNKYKNDNEFKNKCRIAAKKSEIIKKEKIGECYNFVYTQYVHILRAKIDNLPEYMENLIKNEAILEHCEHLLEFDTLYMHFIDNKNYNLYYANIQILKYFIPMMCLKIYKNEYFTEREIEMIKYFEMFENYTNKRPITFHDNLYFLPKEYYTTTKNNFSEYKDRCVKLMLLNNLIADFMKGRTKFNTEKKPY